MPRLSEAGKLALDDLLTQTEKEGRLPGFVLAVSNLDEQIYAKGGGRQVFEDHASPPVTPDSVFWVCSMTKLLVAIAAHQLIERGKLSLDAPVSKYFPEFENAVVLQDPFTNPDPTFKPAENVVTVFHLLTHSSGLYCSLDMSVPAYVLPTAYSTQYEEEKKYEQFFGILRGKYPGIPLVFEPGTSFCYGYSSDVLGLVVEKASGQTLEEFSKENIFGPLGLKNTYHLTAELNARLIDLCFRNPDGSISGWDNRGPLNQRYPQPTVMNLGGVGTYSTLPEYLTILRHLLRIEAGRDVPNAILTRATVKSLFEPKLTPVGASILSMFVQILGPSATDLNWGAGVAITMNDWEGRRKAGSAFWAGWAGTWYFMDPKTGIALVFGSQIVPPLDPVAAEVMDKVEKIVYANLEE